MEPLVITLVPMVMPMVPLDLPLALPIVPVPLVKLPMVPMGDPRTDQMINTSNLFLYFYFYVYISVFLLFANITLIKQS